MVQEEDSLTARAEDSLMDPVECYSTVQEEGSLTVQAEGSMMGPGFHIASACPLGAFW